MLLPGVEMAMFRKLLSDITRECTSAHVTSLPVAYIRVASCENNESCCALYRKD